VEDRVALRQARLAAAPRAAQGHESIAGKRRREGGELALPPEERGRGLAHVRRVLATGLRRRHELGHARCIARARSLDVEDLLRSGSKHVARGRLDPRRYLGRPRDTDRLELHRHIPRGRVPLLAVGRRGAQHERVELGRQARHVPARWVDAPRADLLHGGHVVVAQEEPPPGERLPEHHAGRVNVGPAIHEGSLGLLGRHVPDLPLERPVARAVLAVASLRDPEIEHARDPILANEHVLRRDVAVNDAERVPRFAHGLVRGVQAVERVADDRRRDSQRRRRGSTVGLEVKEARERLSGDVVHHDEELAGVGDHVERRDDVRVADARDDAGLVHEHRGEVRILCQPRVKPLDGHGASEPSWTEEASVVNGGHAPCGDLVVDGVSPEQPRRHHAR
jgi:hypothetical protein